MYKGINELVDIKGLWINGKAVGRDNEDFSSVLKYALVDQKLWSNPKFTSGTMGDVLSLTDDLAVEIALAMIDDDIAHEFSGAQDLAANIALRKGVITAMQSICSGEVDADYVEAVDGIPPTLGYLKNLEVLFAPGANSGDGILTTEPPFMPPDASWSSVLDADSWSGFIFVQNQNIPLSQALTDITPFRGECAGALQLAIMLGCLNGVGAKKLDALAESYGPAFVGLPRLQRKDGKGMVPTFATRFLTQMQDVPKTYERGSAIAVPGDYLYFKNKDDYHKLAPTGGWQGENCIYMGKDTLGNPHYSGLGLAWKTEFALRMFLANAYMTDANSVYLKQRRADKKSDNKLAIIEHPYEQVRFIKRAIMRCPDINHVPQPETLWPTENINPPSDSMMQKQLGLLGFEKTGPGNFIHTKLELKKLMQAFNIGDTEMVPAPSSEFDAAGLTVALGKWTLRIAPENTQIQHLAADDNVHVHAFRSG